MTRAQIVVSPQEQKMQYLYLYLPFYSTKKMHGICHGNTHIIYACIASDMGPAVLKTTNTYQDVSVMWNLYSFYSVWMEKFVPQDLDIFFSRTVFQFQWQKTQVSLSASFSASEVTVKVMQTCHPCKWRWEKVQGRSVSDRTGWRGIAALAGKGKMRRCGHNAWLYSLGECRT